MVMKRLYVERIYEVLLPEPNDRDNGRNAAKLLYQKGNIEDLCNFVEQNYFKVFRNRDYRWANELTVKTAFLTLLYNDLLFIMDSEKETSKTMSQLTSIMDIYPQVLMNCEVRCKPDLNSIPEISDVIKSVEAELGNNGRVLVRYSGTQPVLRVMVEGPEMDKTTELCKKIRDVIRKKIGI